MPPPASVARVKLEQLAQHGLPATPPPVPPLPVEVSVSEVEHVEADEAEHAAAVIEAGAVVEEDESQSVAAGRVFLPGVRALVQGGGDATGAAAGGLAAPEAFDWSKYDFSAPRPAGPASPTGHAAAQPSLSSTWSAGDTRASTGFSAPGSPPTAAAASYNQRPASLRLTRRPSNHFKRQGSLKKAPSSSLRAREHDSDVVKQSTGTVARSLRSAAMPSRRASASDVSLEADFEDDAALLAELNKARAPTPGRGATVVSPGGTRNIWEAADSDGDGAKASSGSPRLSSGGGRRRSVDEASTATASTADPEQREQERARALVASLLLEVEGQASDSDGAASHDGPERRDSAEFLGDDDDDDDGEESTPVSPEVAAARAADLKRRIDEMKHRHSLGGIGLVAPRGLEALREDPMSRAAADGYAQLREYAAGADPPRAAAAAAAGAAGEAADGDSDGDGEAGAGAGTGAGAAGAAAVPQARNQPRTRSRSGSGSAFGAAGGGDSEASAGARAVVDGMTAEALEEYVKERVDLGWVWKKGSASRKKRWQLRHVVVHRGRLMYFKNRWFGGEKRQGWSDLRDVFISRAAAVDYAGTDFQHCIDVSVVTPAKRTYLFALNSAADVKRWEGVLHRHAAYSSSMWGDIETFD